MDKLLFEEFTAWAAETFPTSTPQSCLNHLKTEILELEKEVANRSPASSLEFADCLMLLMDCASRMGYSWEDINAFVKYKFEIVKKRKWGPVNEQGFREHIKDTDNG